MKTTTQPDSLDGSVRLFKALADPVRLRLLSLLLPGREVCVCHLHEALDLPQPTVSRHLAYLRKHGLVVGRKQGLWVHYSLAAQGSKLQRSTLDALTPCLKDSDLLDEDRRRLERAIGCCQGT